MWKFWKRKNWRKYDDTHDGKALAVAQYMLRRRQEAGAGLTLLQLTKLTYVAHGHMLARYMRPLYDEEIQAWPLGPMVPSVYYAVRHFRGRFIDAVPGAPTVAFDAQEREIMDMVADLYGCVDGLSLSSAMHHPGTPGALPGTGTTRMVRSPMIYLRISIGRFSARARIMHCEDRPCPKEQESIEIALPGMPHCPSAARGRRIFTQTLLKKRCAPPSAISSWQADFVSRHATNPSATRSTAR
ncbi:SocA family protein [Cupriavidus sp. EM10]|nr:SocA family protein [Cupriavidus sp. EM10]